MAGRGARNRRREERDAVQGMRRIVATQIPEQDAEILDCGHNHKYISRQSFNCPNGKLVRHCLYCSMEQMTG